MTSKPNGFVDFALRYAELGWRVMSVWSVDANGECRCPKKQKCSTAGKHPRQSKGVKDATTDATKIKKWKSPANVGIATGVESGIIVIDIDPRHGGNESIGRLEKELGELPKTATAITGGGGKHLVFQHPGGNVGNNQDIERGIDMRGDAGYIVAAPSVHASGEEYRWEEGCSPFDIERADLPEAWLRWLQDKRCYRETEILRVREVEETKEMEETKETNAIGRHFDDQVDLDSLEERSKEEIYGILDRTRPRQSGTRNLGVFYLAKELRGVPELENADPRCLRPIVETWHERWKSRMSGEHSFDDSWVDFLYAWERVKQPGRGLDMAALAKQVSEEAPHPACTAKGYKCPRVINIVGLCAKLQEFHGKEPFYLSTRMAARALAEVLGKEFKPMILQRILGALAVDEVLRVQQVGDEHQATRFFFIWTPESDPPQPESPAWLKTSATSGVQTNA